MLVVVEVMSDMECHGGVFGDSQMPWRDNYPDHPTALNCFDPVLPTKVGMISPTKVVGIGVRIVLHILDSINVEWACVIVVRTTTSYTSHLIDLLHRLD